MMDKEKCGHDQPKIMIGGAFANMAMGADVDPESQFEIDPCTYRTQEVFENVTVIISKCEKCGNIDIAWVKQENTQKLDVEAFENGERIPID